MFIIDWAPSHCCLPQLNGCCCGCLAIVKLKSEINIIALLLSLLSSSLLPVLLLSLPPQAALHRPSRAKSLVRQRFAAEDFLRAPIFRRSCVCFAAVCTSSMRTAARLAPDLPATDTVRSSRTEKTPTLITPHTHTIHPLIAGSFPFAPIVRGPLKVTV